MGVARPTPLGGQNYMDVIYSLPLLGIRKGALGLWYCGLGLHQFSSRPISILPESTYLQLTVDVKNPYGENFGIILKIFIKSVQHVAIV